VAGPHLRYELIGSSGVQAHRHGACDGHRRHQCDLQGEWLHEKNGTKVRRSWRKLHIGMDADTGQIVAAALTGKEVDDGSQVGPLLDQVAASVASFTADGAYD